MHRLVTGSAAVRMSANTTVMLPEMFRGFPQFLQANAAIVVEYTAASFFRILSS
jgi:hypothetical protein